MNDDIVMPGDTAWASRVLGAEHEALARVYYATLHIFANRAYA